MKKYRIFYQLLTYSFCDSDSDNIGDFQGIVSKLNYLKKLGIEGILLSPIHKSTSYHGYDVIDYYSVNPVYDKLCSFKNLINECKKYNISIMMDLVLNHTSIEHPWFISAVKYHLGLNNDDTYKDFYIFSYEKRNEVGWHKYSIKNKSIWYYGSFSSSMPDLNYSKNCNFKKDPIFQYMISMCKYYIDLGVSSFRIDAAMHIYETEQGKGDLLKNQKFLKAFKSAINKYKKNILIISEVTLDNKSLLSYHHGNDSLFNFPFAYKPEDFLSFKTIQKKDFPLANMISNHDVGVGRITNKIQDEKQLYYLACLNILLPGIPFIYYGDEIGLLSEIKYKNEKYASYYYDCLYRTSMPWGTLFINSFLKDEIKVNDKEIFSLCATSGTLYNLTVMEQMKQQDNLFSLYKKMIKLRKKYRDIFFLGKLISYRKDSFTIKYNHQLITICFTKEKADINTKYFNIKILTNIS